MSSRDPLSPGFRRDKAREFGRGITLADVRGPRAHQAATKRRTLAWPLTRWSTPAQSLLCQGTGWGGGGGWANTVRFEVAWRPATSRSVALWAYAGGQAPPSPASHDHDRCVKHLLGAPRTKHPPSSYHETLAVRNEKSAASEDRTHNLGIMRPTRSQLRCSRLSFLLQASAGMAPP